MDPQPAQQPTRKETPDFTWRQLQGLGGVTFGIYHLMRTIPAVFHAIRQRRWSTRVALELLWGILWINIGIWWYGLGTPAVAQQVL